MRIDFSDGRPREDVTDLDEARQVLSQLMPHAVYSDEQQGRILVWRDEADSMGRHGEGDDGSLAVAEILFDRDED